MRVPYSDRSDRPFVCVCPLKKKWSSPFHSTYVSHIYQTCKLHVHFTFEWPWLGRNGYNKSVLQYVGVLHSPNLHQLFILTWSTDVSWVFVFMTGIDLHFKLSDQDTNWQNGNSGAVPITIMSSYTLSLSELSNFVSVFVVKDILFSLHSLHFLKNDLFFRAWLDSCFPYSCCGAGTAADTEMTTQMISSQLELHRLNTDRVPRVCTANRLLKQMLFRYGNEWFYSSLFWNALCNVACLWQWDTVMIR